MNLLCPICDEAFVRVNELYYCKNDHFYADLRANIINSTLEQSFRIAFVRQEKISY